MAKPGPRTHQVLARLGQRIERNGLASLLMAAARKFMEDDGLDRAAAIAYNSALSLFPLALALLGILGAILPSETVQSALFEMIDRHAPAISSFVRANMEGLIANQEALGLIGLVGMVWTGSTVFGSVSRAIDRAWGIRHRRPYLIQRLRYVGMMLGMGVLLLLSLGIAAALSIMEGLRIFTATGIAFLGSRLLAFALVLGVFLIVYKSVPNTKTSWRIIWPGSLFAAVLFEVVRAGFLLYLEHFAMFDALYGPVAATAVGLIWLFLSATVLIFGAELIATYSGTRTTQR